MVGPVEVGRVAHGGHFVARYEGRVIFVRHTLPGELVMVRLTEVGHARFWRGDAVEIRRAAPDRVDPPCRVPPECGGLEFQHIRLDAQRRLKAEVISEQLDRLAGLHREVVVEPVPGAASNGLDWRTRMRYLVRDGRAGMRAYRSNDFVELPPQGCLIADPRGPRGTELDVFARRAGRELLVTTAASGVSIMSEGRMLAGDLIVREQVGQRQFRVRADGFWQVHPGAAGTLSEAVLAAVEPRPAETALDLYCGVGVFAAALSDAGARVTGVELDGPAIRLAGTNVPEARFVAGRVERALGSLPGHCDLVVLDPPRSGAGRQVVAGIAARTPSRVAYVACDPAALARDLASFGARGYRVSTLRAFDMFPMTHHVECLAILERSTSRPGQPS
ncbi:class I SAM-dependent RNA methyltransferase [Propionibacterium cyclohexanicum]|uniref:class I SAM-dependent RNA methyltransferase n=1 Tax=Propionibacterium cyclohexanicum TaxID=64702 RepID=UPI001FE12880|nr:TRAM domain-containing protein [Propionibacterium cyclohexanicum]